MKQLSPISLANENSYTFFHPVKKPYNFIVKILVVDQYVELSEEYYDVFDCGDSVIIGFREINGRPLPIEANPFCVQLERSSGESYLIEMEDFANIMEVFGILPARKSYLYWTMDSVVITDTFTENVYSAVSSRDRCDTVSPSYGPWRFEVRDGVKETSYDYEQIPQSSWFGLNRILTAPGDGHILRMTLTGDIGDWKNWPLTTVAGTSLVEAVQLMLHWAAIAQADSSIKERVAIKSKDFKNALNLSQDLINEINLYCPETSVSKYFSGEQNSRDRQDSSVECGPLFKEYLSKKICYSTLSSLVKNSPVSVTIDQETLSQDKEKISAQLLQFFHSNGIDYSSKSAKEMLMELWQKIDSGNWFNIDRRLERLLQKYIAITHE